MITHAFDLAVVNSWLEYRLDAKRANFQKKTPWILLYFKMNVAQCLVSVHKPVAAKSAYVCGTLLWVHVRVLCVDHVFKVCGH